MFKKSLLSLSLIAALSVVLLSALATTYLVVMSTPGIESPYAAIDLELSPTIRPVGWVGDPFFGFNFNSALRSTGDPVPHPNLVEWSVFSGVLLAGLSLSKESTVYELRRFLELPHHE